MNTGEFIVSAVYSIQCSTRIHCIHVRIGT